MRKIMLSTTEQDVDLGTEKMRMVLRRKTDPRTGKHTYLVRACTEGTSTCHKSHFVYKK